MSLSIPIPTWIIYGKISQYLAAKDISRNKYYRGGDLTSDLSRQIRRAWKLVEFKYNQDNDDETLEDTGRYLYALCGKYIRAAQRIVASGEEGELVNPSTGNAVTLLGLLVQFEIGQPGALMSVGETELTLPYSGIIENNIEVEIDNTPLPVNRTDRQSYTAVVGASSTTITFQFPVSDTNLIVVHGLRLIDL